MLRISHDSSANRTPEAERAAVSATPLVSVSTFKLRNADDLREATLGADLKVVQLASGSFEGQLTHARIDALHVSAGDFYPDIRARGVMNPDLVTVGMMVESNGDVMQWDYDVVPGDIVVFPRAVEQEGRFTGRSRYVTVTLSEEDLALHATGEDALQDPGFWTRIHRFRASHAVRAFIRSQVAGTIAQLRGGMLPDSAAAASYFRRSLLEAFIVGMLDQQAAGRHERKQPIASRLVRAVEDYADALSPERPIHISELCLAMRVSRRTLHRCFQDVLGIGPAEYLRLKRLAAVHRTLSSACSMPENVTRVALDAGFSDLGRFAFYYRRIYGEAPSRTQKRAIGMMT